MNLEKLEEFEQRFFMMYPEGFDSFELVSVRKKHNIDKVSKYVKDVLSKENLDKGLMVVEDIIKVVSKSSMVSVFEKMKFRDYVRAFDEFQKQDLIDAVYENVHGDEEKGFNMLIRLLSRYKIAKWPILTVFRCYYNLEYDILVKPTTVKNVIKNLELDIKYSPTATYKFYNQYRTLINQLKDHVDPRLSPNNPAFSGFLMMTMN